MRPLPHKAHKAFVETEGWEQKRSTGRGKRTAGDHFRYTLRLATGDVLYTRVSHGTGSLNDPNTIAAVLRDQLRVSEDDFWRCVDDGVLPPRPQPPRTAVPAEGIDAKLLRNLARKVGVSPADLEGLTQEEAVQIWNDWLTTGGSRTARALGGRER